MDAIPLENLSPQQRRDLLKRLMAAEAQQQSFPVSSAQERLWFLDRFEPGSAAYNMVTAVRFCGPLMVDALRHGIDTLVRRHESLRTVFAEHDDRPVQIVLDRLDIPLTIIDFSGEAVDEREPRAMKWMEREARVPFDLCNGPLIRVHLIKLAEHEHFLLLCMHHIIGDGWSNGILCDELRQLYNDAKARRPSSLAPLPIRFVDFATWERERLERGEFNDQIAQWKQLLSGAPPVLELPGDRPRPAVESHRGERLRFPLDAALVDGLRKLARSEGATLYMALLAVFDTLLYRYTGQSDLVVGTPVANRNRGEVEGVIGFFTNTLPLRVTFDGDDNFRKLLGRVRDAALALYAIAEVPFERLVQELRPTRNLSHSPIFQVMLSYNSVGSREWGLDGAEGKLVRVETGTSKFDLMLHFEDEPQGIVGALEYSTDLFNDDTARRLVQHFLNLFAAVTENADEAIARVPMLSPKEHEQVVEDCNATSVDFGDEGRQCLHTLIEAQTARTPDAVAVRCGGQRITYAQLDQRAELLAVELRRAGVGPDGLVGVFMDRSIELVIALLGTLKAGGAYVPIDPSYPANRIAFMIEDSRASVLLTQPHLKDRVPHSRAAVICIDGRGHISPVASAASHTSPRVTSDHLCYVIFTSGSTGRPKGVMIPHRAIVNHMLWMRRAFPLREGDRVLQKTPISFDASVWEFYAPLLCGAELVMAAPDVHRSPRDLVQCVIDHGITTLQLVPTMLDAMLDEPLFDRCTTLKRVYCGGEALTSRLAQRFHSKLAAELINLYGPTEAAIDSVIWRCERGDDVQPVQPIGRPIDNLTAYVLDAAMQPVPIGVTGELYLGGAGLARGYLHRPDLTAQRFVPNPLSRDTAARLYRTGDLARRRHDGVLEFVGRADHQIKLRGHRIELGEIEAALAQQPGVTACTVIVRDDGTGPRLVAYVVPTPGGAQIDEHRLRDALRNELPDHMVPAAYVVLDRLPLTPNGKIDRAALPVPQRSATVSEDPAARPTSAMERSLVSIWSEVLKLEHVGVHDNFFELGGHSLMAAQVISRVRSAHKIEAPLRTLFELPTIARLAAALERMASSHTASTATIKRIDRTARPVSRPATDRVGAWAAKDKPTT